MFISQMAYYEVVTTYGLHISTVYNLSTNFWLIFLIVFATQFTDVCVIYL